MDAFKSVAIWAGIALLILFWLPMLAIRRVFDRDPALYYTGRLFRRLGKAISRVNPNWNVHLSGRVDVNDRQPYVMVCNHLSQADIPVISNLPWEMKWVAKKELFDTPVIGWMLTLAGDIAVDRSRKSSIVAFRKATNYLDHHCSVIFFPEGTRSRSGTLNRFARGAFELAVRANVPILPLVLDDTQNCLPKNSWKFGKAQHIKLKVLDPIPTKNRTPEDVNQLQEQARGAILGQLGEWRGQSIEAIDATN